MTDTTEEFEHKWEDWAGDIDRPAGIFAQVEVRLRNGEVLKTYAGAGRWDHQDKATDVVAWRRTSFNDEPESQP